MISNLSSTGGLAAVPKVLILLLELQNTCTLQSRVIFKPSLRVRQLLIRRGLSASVYEHIKKYPRCQNKWLSPPPGPDSGVLSKVRVVFPSTWLSLCSQQTLDAYDGDGHPKCGPPVSVGVTTTVLVSRPHSSWLFRLLKHTSHIITEATRHILCLNIFNDFATSQYEICFNGYERMKLRGFIFCLQLLQCILLLRVPCTVKPHIHPSPVMWPLSCFSPECTTMCLSNSFFFFFRKPEPWTNCLVSIVFTITTNLCLPHVSPDLWTVTDAWASSCSQSTYTPKC